MRSPVMLNPYQSPDITAGSLPPTARRDAAFIWFAATVVGLTCVWMSAWFAYWNADQIDQFLPIDFFFESIEDAGPIAIAAILLYAAMRTVFRSRFDYASTSRSLIVAGILVFACAALIDYGHRFRWFGDRVWLVGFGISLPLGWGIAALERKIAGSFTHAAGETIPIRKQAGHASILWFAATILLSIFAISSFQFAGSNASILRRLRDLSEMSAMISIVLTVAYGLLSVCIIRQHPATNASRVTAALVCLGVLYAMSFAWLNPPSWSIFVLISGPALFAVPADRLVARYAAAT